MRTSALGKATTAIDATVRGDRQGTASDDGAGGISNGEGKTEGWNSAEARCGRCAADWDAAPTTGGRQSTPDQGSSNEGRRSKGATSDRTDISNARIPVASSCSDVGTAAITAASSERTARGRRNGGLANEKGEAGGARGIGNGGSIEGSRLRRTSNSR